MSFKSFLNTAVCFSTYVTGVLLTIAVGLPAQAEVLDGVMITELSLHQDGTVTVRASEPFTACAGSDYTYFLYAPETVKSDWYMLLSTARAAQLPVRISYSYASSVCTLISLRIYSS